MKKIINTLLLICMVMSIKAQIHLEVEGKANISIMEEDSLASNVVVRQPDGTLAMRNISAFIEYQIISISNDSIFLSNGGFAILPDEIDPIFAASVASNVSETDTTNWNNKQNQIVAGTNISITGDTISVANANTLAIGDSYQGGIIFWLDGSGQHGLIAATSDLSSGIPWSASFTQTNAVRNGVGAGKLNTERIITDQGAANYAAQLCANYLSSNFGDWYLPARHELYLLYGKRTIVGGFSNDNYWTSGENDSFSAFARNFNTGGSANASKHVSYRVRPIRSF